MNMVTLLIVGGLIGGIGLIYFLIRIGAIEFIAECLLELIGGLFDN